MSADTTLDEELKALELALLHLSETLAADIEKSRHA